MDKALQPLLSVASSKPFKIVLASGLLFVTSEIAYELYLWLRKPRKPKPKACEVFFINRRRIVDPFPTAQEFLFEHINRVVSHIDRAEKSICLAMYIFTMREIAEAVIRAKRERSVIVRVVTCNSMVGNEGSYLRELIEEGIVVQYKYNCDYLMHHKYCLLDTEWYCANCLIAYHIAEYGEPTKNMQHTLFDKAVMSDQAGLLKRFGSSCARCKPGTKKTASRQKPASDPLPKNGMLVAGSSNWTFPGLTTHWDTMTYTSLTELVDPYTVEFQRMWYELNDPVDKSMLKNPMYKTQRTHEKPMFSPNGPLSLETSQELKVLPNPDRYSPTERWQMKEAVEAEDFYGEHYAMDYIQYSIDKLGICVASLPVQSKLTEDQSYRIKAIVEEKQRQKDLYKSIEDHGTILLGLIDVLLAIVYDRLTNGNELNEANSHINIHRLAATLSCFVEFEGVHQMLRSFYRRSCTYPYYRHKDISEMCVQHVAAQLACEERPIWIQQQLLHAYNAFKTTDCAVLNHYFIKDYIRYTELGLDTETLQLCVGDMEKALTGVHQDSLGFGEEVLVQTMLRDIMGQEDSDSTDSDDYESTDDSGSDNESVASEDESTNPNENVLEKLMNLNLSG
uniref:Mitochondrial cardiolipin hydrolase n=1 Tax=Anopheles dirus TaxID=7168 RepID=A0A182N949_9DIPT